MTTVTGPLRDQNRADVLAANDAQTVRNIREGFIEAQTARIAILEDALQELISASDGAITEQKERITTLEDVCEALHGVIAMSTDIISGQRHRIEELEAAEVALRKAAAIDKGGTAVILTDEQYTQFSEAAKPLIEWLNKNGHPHLVVVVDGNSAELLVGSARYQRTTKHQEVLP